ncbi:MAG: HAD family phosphatase [Candidatus Nanopelagicales bacterium]|jgi:beta-phosphoglucomutase-like phosphatase (HAD superfamily)|nr:HAD family phosphatase [Candidatus Nanopelagicales bacterium]MDP4824962.1 HAD family phosphatase [Candidatus Nanopelagicales bacterium]MDP4887708.1 HAD family phosphatase [Candidatus Nanopelagicales bacterium]
MPPKPAAVLWDLDGTLIDSEGVWLAAETQLMAGLGVDWTEADQRWCLGGPMDRVTAYMRERVVRTTGQVVPEANFKIELLQRMEDMLSNTPPQWQTGSISLLRELVAAEIPLGLVTASHRTLLRALEQVLDVDLPALVSAPDKPAAAIFQITVAGDEVARTKPDPMPYLFAAQSLNVSIADCIVLEDSPTGVASGVASGAMVIAIEHLTPIEAGPRCHVVSNLADLDVNYLATLLDLSPTQSPDRNVHL